VPVRNESKLSYAVNLRRAPYTNSAHSCVCAFHWSMLPRFGVVLCTWQSLEQ
jgi:hypothetical protein